MIHVRFVGIFFVRNYLVAAEFHGEKFWILVSIWQSYRFFYSTFAQWSALLVSFLLLCSWEGANYCDEHVSLSDCFFVSESTYISHKLYGQTSPNFQFVLIMPIAWSFSVSIMICYVVLVLWMTSCFHTIGHVVCHPKSTSTSVSYIRIRCCINTVLLLLYVLLLSEKMT